MSPDEDNAFFASGVHEDVMTRLEQTPGTQVA
jgi:TolB-like protein